MIGKTFGDMKIVEVQGFSKSRNSLMLLVKCTKCGRMKIVQKNNLVRGVGVSHKWCCRQIEGKYTKHFHRKWADMRTRTTNVNHDRYANYGGRGISSDAWEYFIDFYDDMYESYLEHVREFGEKNTSLERINVNGNYCKENCTWVTLKEQASNRTTNKQFKAISPKGEVFFASNQKEFALAHGLSPQNINNCLHGRRKSHKGWMFNYVDN